MEDLYNKNQSFESEGEKNIKMIDPYDPFDNPTENHEYNGNYTEIVPQIEIEGCKIPYKPSNEEKKRIKHFYNIAGGGILLHFLLTIILASSLSFIALMIIMSLKGVSFSEYLSGGANYIYQYIKNSSIEPSINLLSYLLSNLLVFFVGIKISGVKFSSLFKTTDLTIKKVIQYTLIGIFLQFGTGIIVNLIQMFVQEADVAGNSESVLNFCSSKSMLISVFYTCIVAPITEEFFYRGFVMKSFSKVSQRFGILMSAFFFGIAHLNISQFVFAFAVGIFMGFIDTKHNSLIPSILVHFACNFIGTFASVIELYFSTDSTIYNFANYFIIGLVLIGIIMLVKFCKNNTFPKATIHQCFRCKNIAFKSVGPLVSAAIYIIYTLNITFSK